MVSEGGKRRVATKAGSGLDDRLLSEATSNDGLLSEATSNDGLLLDAGLLVDGLLESKALNRLNRGGGGFLGGSGSADDTAFFAAVRVHPVRVGLALTSFGPGFALAGTFLSSFVCISIVSGVFVGAGFFDCGATSGRSFADITARLHTVSFHPRSVSITFTLGGPGVALRIRVGFALVLGLVSGASTSFDGIITSANRAARFGAVGEHPVGVSGAFFVLGPGGAVSIRISAFGFGFGAEVFNKNGHFIGGFFCGFFFSFLFCFFNDFDGFTITFGEDAARDGDFEVITILGSFAFSRGKFVTDANSAVGSEVSSALGLGLGFVLGEGNSDESSN